MTGGMVRKIRSVLLLSGICLFTGCSSSHGNTPGTEGAPKTTITVAAAASLRNVFERDLIPAFEAEFPGISVEGVYDGSGRLQRQIEEGLAADVFMPAALKQVAELDEEGLIASGTVREPVVNKLVLIVPKNSEFVPESFEAVVDAGSIAVGDPASVPAGEYAKEALGNLGVWDEIQGKLSFGTSVTEVLNQVAAASADAGFVYATDAAGMADQVTIAAEAPEGSLKNPVIYPAAIMKNTAHAEEARTFLDFLCSDIALEKFEAYGFAANPELRK